MLRRLEWRLLPASLCCALALPAAAPQHADIVGRMVENLHAWQRSVERSLSGADYR